MAQGRLLLQDTFMVSDQDGGLLSRMKERRVFLFEQIVIFSEPLDKKKGFSTPGYLFKNSIKVHSIDSDFYSLLLVIPFGDCLFIVTGVVPSNTCHWFCHKNTILGFFSSFPLLLSSSICVILLQVSWLGLEENTEDPCKFTLTSRSSSGNLERYTLHSPSPGVSQVWVHQVSQILENQRNFLNGKIKMNHVSFFNIL